MLLIHILCARSVRLTVPRLDRSCGLIPRLFSLGTSITICICAHPIWSLHVHIYPHYVPPPLNIPRSTPALNCELWHNNLSQSLTTMCWVCLFISTTHMPQNDFLLSLGSPWYIPRNWWRKNLSSNINENFHCFPYLLTENCFLVYTDPYMYTCWNLILNLAKFMLLQCKVHESRNWGAWMLLQR